MRQRGAALASASRYPSLNVMQSTVIACEYIDNACKINNNIISLYEKEGVRKGKGDI